jgi:DNA-binding NarL/FixJ family response regulator
MGALMRSHDWNATPLGPPEHWPWSLKSTLRLVLTSNHPMFIWWVPQLIQFPIWTAMNWRARLRARPETARATLIAVTGYGQEYDRSSSIAAGFDHYFVKPADTDRLLALLSDIYPLARAA